MHVRFAGLFKRVNIGPPSQLPGGAKDLGFDDEIFFMAAALDPNFGFRWLEDLPGSLDAKEELRQHIIGIRPFVLCYGAHNGANTIAFSIVTLIFIM